MAAFLALSDGRSALSMALHAPSYPSSPGLAKENRTEKMELEIRRLAGWAEGAQSRRGSTIGAVPTSARVPALSVLRKSASLKASMIRKVKGRPRMPNQLEKEAHESLDEERIHFSEGEKRLLEALASHDGKGRANSSSNVLFKSIGSRSSPSRSSIPGRRSKYSKLDPKLIKKARSIVSHSSGLRELLHSPNSEDEMTEIDDKEEIEFGWYDSDLEDDEEGTYLTQPDSKMLVNDALQSCKSEEENDAEDREKKDATVPLEEEMNSPNQHDVICVVASKERKILEKSNERAEAKHELEPTYPNNHNTSKHSSLCGEMEQDVRSWKSHPLCDLPFEIQYSYSETPTNTPILGLREHLSPFGPTTMQRPWTGLPPVKRRRHLENAVNPVLRKFILNCYPEGPAVKQLKSREEILGIPLSKEEITYLVNKCHQENRQVNLGRDGLTHNMLHLIHTHWKTRPVCKIKCRGVPTVDMDNVCFHVEDKTGGKVIYRTGGVVYAFRGRNYNYRASPRIPLMLWKPASPIYPMLVPKAPLGLTGDEAYQLRVLGQKVEPLCKLDKNGVYLNLVDDIRDAFQIDELVVLEYDGLKSTDYKKLAAKLRDLVPCIILSFRNRRILLWRGRGTATSVANANVHSDGHGSFEAVSQEPWTFGQEIGNENLAIGKYIGASLGEQSLDCFNMSTSKLHTPPKQNDDATLYSGNNCDGSVVSEGLSHIEIVHPAMDHSDVNGLQSKESIDDDVEKHMQVGECTSTMDWKYMNELRDEADIEECRSTGDRSYTNVSDDEASISSGSDALLGQKNVNGSYNVSSFSDNLGDLWDLALRCEMALELEDVNNLDADLILQKTHTFSKVAPVGPDYSEKLVNRLRIEVDDKKKEQKFEIHFYTKYRKTKNHS